jgi:hypothetical protein
MALPNTREAATCGSLLEAALRLEDLECIRRTYGAGGIPKSLWRPLKRLGTIVVLEDHKLFRLRWTLVFHIDSDRPRFRARLPMPGSVTTPEERRGGVAKR